MADASARYGRTRHRRGDERRKDDPLIPDASVDLILIVNAIHLVKEKTVFLNNLRKSLKKKGRLVFIQWDAEKMDSELPGWDPKDRAILAQDPSKVNATDEGHRIEELERRKKS